MKKALSELSHNQEEKNSTVLSKIADKQEKACYKGFAKDGNGNTRLKPIQVVEGHLDYLRVAGSCSDSQEFALLASYISQDYSLEFDTPWSPGRGGNFFPNRIIGSRKVKGGFEIQEDGSVDYMIDLSGEYFEGKSVVDQWRLVTGLKAKYQGRATRIDCAIDDYSYSVIPIAEMLKACQEGHNFGFRKIGHHSSGFCGEEQRETYEFGSRESGKFVRVYDHDSESLRFEAEFKREYAKQVFEAIAALERPSEMPDEKWEIELQKFFASIAVGAIDFRNRGNRKDKKRAGERDSVRLEFYQNFIDFLDCQHFRMKLKKPAKSILKSINWIIRQCSPVLSTIQQGMGKINFVEWLNDKLFEASYRLDKEKEIWIKDMQRNPRMYMI